VTYGAPADWFLHSSKQPSCTCHVRAGKPLEMEVLPSEERTWLKLNFFTKLPGELLGSELWGQSWFRLPKFNPDPEPNAFC